MLALRLTEGLVFEKFEKRYGKTLPEDIMQKAKLLLKHGLVTVDGEKIALTKQGFLLSNSVICELLANY